MACSQQQSHLSIGTVKKVSSKTCNVTKKTIMTV
jgi:hypothetical protein